MNRHRLAHWIFCRQCGASITPRLTDLKRNRGKFCGRTCSNKYLAKFGLKKSIVQEIVLRHPTNRKLEILFCDFANFSRAIILEAVTFHLIKAEKLDDCVNVNSGGISVSANDEPSGVNHVLVSRIHQKGIVYRPHEPQYASDEMLRKADIVLVSDTFVLKSVQERLGRLYPRYLRGTQKVLLFVDLHPRVFGGNRDIQDTTHSSELSSLLIDKVIKVVQSKFLPLLRTMPKPRRTSGKPLSGQTTNCSKTTLAHPITLL